MRDRTRAFGVRVMRLAESLPRTRSGNVVAGQLLRSGTSVGSNYRAAARARSRADFIAKLGIVEEEADEVACWLEVLVESGIMSKRRVGVLLQECDEILAIVVASIRTAKQNR
jgi:four helix bundle protein